MMVSDVGQKVPKHLHSISYLKNTIVTAPVVTKEHLTRVLFLTGTPFVIFLIFRTRFTVVPFSVSLTMYKHLSRF